MIVPRVCLGLIMVLSTVSCVGIDLGHGTYDSFYLRILSTLLVVDMLCLIWENTDVECMDFLRVNS